MYLGQTKQKLAELSQNDPRKLPLPKPRDIEKAQYFNQNFASVKNQDNFIETEKFGYEAILDNLRKQEADILNRKRAEQIQEIKGGQRAWEIEHQSKENSVPGSAHIGPTATLLNKLNIKGLY